MPGPFELAWATKVQGASADGYAFARSGGCIYVREKFSTGQTALQRPFTIIHEYGRVFLYKDLPADTGEAQKDNINTWDTIIRSLVSDYDRIKALP